MTIAISGLIVSVVLSGLLLLLFRYERKRGERFLESVRMRLDLVLVKIHYLFHTKLRLLSNEFFRQLFRYLYHTILKMALTLVTNFEKRIRENIKINKTLARHAEREDEALTKLEELALHKAEYALTEEEKRRHKDQALNG